MSENVTKSVAVDWVECNTKRTLTPEQARAVDVICAIRRPYNLRLINDGWHGATDYNTATDSVDDELDAQDQPPTPAVTFHPYFIIVRMHESLSTFDWHDLTDLVVAAHRHHVRVDISAERIVSEDRDSSLSRLVGGEWVDTDERPRYFGTCLSIQLNARKSEGANYERHPGLDHLVTKARAAS